MDAAVLYFREGTTVSVEDARAYQDSHIYCVAPIVGQPLGEAGGGDESGAFILPPSGTIDFWAVGVDCCLPSGEKFTCADVNNPL